MKRREFLKGVGAAALPLAHAPSLSRLPTTSKLIEGLVKKNDERIETFLDGQNRKAGDTQAGGFADRYNIYHAGTAASCVRSLICGFVSAHSRYHLDPQVAESLELAIAFLSRIQHADGTIDLLTTNFHSPPDTGFVVEPLAVGLSCLKQHAPQQLVEVQTGIGKFLESAGQALSRGGIHTPNHRWVVCQALAWTNHFIPEQKFTRRIEQWLAEGIDIDADGQYSEKSAAVYTPLVNRCLITVARLLDKPELYEPVRQNLQMTQYLVRPSGEIVTEASKRQDQFRVTKMHGYHYPYRYMALLDNDPIFAGMTQMITATCDLASLSNDVGHFLEDPRLSRDLPSHAALESSYERTFVHSNLVRIRRENRDITIVGSSDRILTFQKGAATLQALRLATAFFGKGQFVADTISKDQGGWVLSQTLTGPYFQPLLPAQIPPDGDWSKMPRELRRQSEVQTLLATIRIEEDQGRLTIQFDIAGTENVPVAVELGFRGDGQLTGVRPVDRTPAAFLLDGGTAQFQSGTDTIEFGIGMAEHSWTQLRGALPKLDAQSVYITGFTPFHHQMTIQ